MDTPEIARQLKLALACINVCVAALRHQNADEDADIAVVLVRLAGDPLDKLLDQLDPDRRD